jgi:hypothetical protein
MTAMQTLCGLAFSSAVSAFNGVEKVEYRGFKDCYRLFNGKAEAIVVAESGGRVLAFQLEGKNVLYADPKLDGKSLATEKGWFNPDAGRLDIGPETGGVPPRLNMWLGQWKASITGDRELTLDSPKDEKIGVVQRRMFRLDATLPYLLIGQRIENVSNEVTRYCFWGRSLAPAGGICVLPLNPKSKFAKGWAMYPLKDENLSNPQDPRVTAKDQHLLIRPGGKGSKFGTDSLDGWMAYFRDGLLFAKRYACSEDGKYTDGAGFSAEIWVQEEFIELEPLSPEAVLKPGETYTFTENWWIIPWPAGDVEQFDLAAAVRMVKEGTTFPK